MLVLATDMARHSEIVENFNSKLDSFDFKNREYLNSVRQGEIELIYISRPRPPSSSLPSHFPSPHPPPFPYPPTPHPPPFPHPPTPLPFPHPPTPHPPTCSPPFPLLFPLTIYPSIYLTCRLSYQIHLFFHQLKMILVKCCDISNEVRPMEVSDPWVDCLLEEYFMQV